MSKSIEFALKEFVKACKEKFGKNLVSIVLFGSRVKGYSRKDSDFDILLVIKKLPSIKERFALVESLEDRIWDKHKIKISCLLFEPEEIFDPINPLLFGVLSGYRILFGVKGWKNYLNEAKGWITNLDPVYIEGEREWRVKDLI